MLGWGCGGGGGQYVGKTLFVKGIDSIFSANLLSQNYQNNARYCQKSTNQFLRKIRFVSWGCGEAY